MSPLSLKIVCEDGAVTRTMMFDSSATVGEAVASIADRVHAHAHNTEYGLFQMSAKEPSSGIWLEESRPLEYYMLRDGDSLHYLPRIRTLRVRMLDGTVKAVQVDESKQLGDLMPMICRKIGVSDHEEYGLCKEEINMDEDVKEAWSIGTLTLKRKPLGVGRDAKMEELSKKLRTDDNVRWLDLHKTLREMAVGPAHTVLLKRRLFYSDRNVDSRDPVQLNLLYAQTRDAILRGTHPVTQRQAFTFAGLQCHIQHGDFDEDIHKPGLIENLTEYLPAQYASSRNAEKRILKLHAQHRGLSGVAGRLLYIKTARDLPTYGVTFFLVKEIHKDKKKMVHRLLGISSEAVLRLDERTKEVIQVWPLTQVLRYRTGGNNTFTLDFGDYSDKQYSVQTTDADRICSILRGYIDLISRKKAAPHHAAVTEGGSCVEENVESASGNEVTYISHKQSKVIEQSFIGSSKIISYEKGQDIQQGTQIMTVQQVILTNRGSSVQQTLSGEVRLRNDMSLEFVRKLNKLNTDSVKIVSLLADSSDVNMREAKKIICEMQELMPDIRTGINETISKQSCEEDRKKLLQQLAELDSYIDSLSSAAQNKHNSEEEIEEAAKKIADLSTEMYFSVDPRTRKRSDLVRRSRKSFIQDEKVEATLRRASLIAAAGTASSTIDSAKQLLKLEYQGQALSEDKAKELQAAAVDNLGKINAAVAMYLSSHADATNIDYSAAVTSMNTIHELIPELAKDAQALSSTKEGKSKEELINHILEMLEATKHVSMLTGVDDHKKMQEIATQFAEMSGKLIYIIGRGNGNLNPDKENEVLDLTTEACNMATQLLVKVNELTNICQTDPDAEVVDKFGVNCAHIISDLMLTAQLTAPSISEPHCRSALTASVEALASSSVKLAHAWRPLAQAHAQRLREENNCNTMEELESCTKQLDQALDRLRQSYAEFENEENALNGVEVEQSPERIRFIMSVNAVKESVKKAEQELDGPNLTEKPNAVEISKLESSVQEKMAQINAAVASLIQAKSDAESPDYETLQLAMNTITETMPTLTKESKQLISGIADERSVEVVGDIGEWCRAVAALCTRLHSQGQILPESIEKFAEASQRLMFVFSPRANRAKEQLLQELSEAVHSRALQMASHCCTMADTMGGHSGQRLRYYGPRLEGQTDALRKSVKLTAPTISSPRCQSVVVSSVDAVSETSKELVSEAKGLQDDETGCRVRTEKLDKQRSQIESDARILGQNLEEIRNVCLKTSDENPTQSQTETFSINREQERLMHKKVTEIEETEDENAKQKKEKENFTKVIEVGDNVIKSAEEQLKEVTGSHNVSPLDSTQCLHIRVQLEENLAKASAAASKFLTTQNAETLDYNKASEVARSLTELIPQIAKDAAILSNGAEEKTRITIINETISLCEATRQLCNCSAMANAQLVNEAALRFGDSGTRLRFLVSPRFDARQEKEVIFRAKKIGEAASHLSQGTISLRLDPSVEKVAMNVAKAASIVLYTAKLVASSIEHLECQAILIQACKDLSTHLEPLRTTLQNVKNMQNSEKIQNQITELSGKAKNLGEILKEFEKDVEERQMVVLNEEDEESGLKKLADKIVKHAKQMSKILSLEKDKSAYASYADKLTRDIKILNSAIRNCRNTKNLNSYNQMEKAVQQLQVSVLQTSPALRAKPHTNVIDLTEFTKAVSCEVKKLIPLAHQANMLQEKRTISNVLKHCQQMTEGADRIINPSATQSSEDSLQDILEVDHFGQDCENNLEEIEALVQSLEDGNEKKAIQHRVMMVEEACNLLRFASKSALATAQSATLDETLNDLVQLEKRMDQLLVPRKDERVQLHSALQEEAKISLQSAAVAVCNGKALDLPAAVIKYAVHCMGRDGAKEHLSKVIHKLTLCCGAASARIGVWEHPGDSVKDIVKEVLQEINQYWADSSELDNMASGVDRLLLPAQEHTFHGDHKQLEDKLQKSASKLFSLTSIILASASRADSLARTIPVTVSTALELDQIVRASGSTNPVQNKNVEEESREMRLVTYKFLKAAENVCKNPSSSEYKRKLFEACRNLNDLIDKLIHTVSTANKLHKNCNELQRRLQWEQNGLQISHPMCTLPYSDCLEAFKAHEEIICTLNNDETITHEEFAQSLSEVATNVRNTAQFAGHCGYLLSLLEFNKKLALGGLADMERLQRLSSAVQGSCVKILRTTELEQIKHETKYLYNHLEELNKVITEVLSQIEGNDKIQLDACASRMDEAANHVQICLKGNSDQIHSSITSLLVATDFLKSTIENAIPTPTYGELSSQTKSMVDEIAENCKNLLTTTVNLVKEVASSDSSENMTWVTYNTSRKEVLQAFERLLTSLRKNGQTAGLVADGKEEGDEKVEQKSYLQTQVIMANTWLQRIPFNPKIQKNGEKAVLDVIELARQLCEDLSGQENEEVGHLIMECEQLVSDVSRKYDLEKATLLSERVRELSKYIERGTVSRVVEGFVGVESALTELTQMMVSETDGDIPEDEVQGKDKTQRKFLLEQKIKELMTQLSRVKRTARFVTAVSASSPAARKELTEYCEQVDLLAPQLISAAQAHTVSQEHHAMDDYMELLKQYEQSMSRVRDLCDASVDPVVFVQTAGDLMQRWRVTSVHDSGDTPKTEMTFRSIKRLAKRVIDVSVSSARVQTDPEIQNAVRAARTRVDSALLNNSGTIRDWNYILDELIRTTGEVESALSGETIFNRNPEPDQPIYNAAHDLHAAVREWSARDNELVGGAKRVAVLMARLAAHVHNDAKRELISTSNSIVSESKEVARLARILATECTDVRIRTNLLQVCERIPTISGQLKMLTTVKASSFGRQGSAEDKEAMNMLICNAQNLMSSVQEVVKAGASASVKILSQRGPRVRWVRKLHY